MARDLRKNMTDEQQRLWSHLRSNRMCDVHFRRQQVIDGFIVDFYCHSAALAIDLVGDDTSNEHDHDRDAALAGLGLRVLRIPDRRIKTNMNAVLLEIAGLIATCP